MHIIMIFGYDAVIHLFQYTYRHIFTVVCHECRLRFFHIIPENEALYCCSLALSVGSAPLTKEPLMNTFHRFIHGSALRCCRLVLVQYLTERTHPLVQTTVSPTVPSHPPYHHQQDQGYQPDPTTPTNQLDPSPSLAPVMQLLLHRRIL